MKIGKIVDLSYELHPGDESSELYIKTYSMEEIFPKYKLSKDQWYIIQKISFMSHIGTHIESPLHFIKNGQDVSKISLKRLIGEAVIIDMTHKKPNEEMDIEDFLRYEDKINPGDIVFLHTSCNKYVDLLKTEYHHPYLATEATKWLVNKGISCLGIDSSGVEKKGESSYAQPNHHILLANGVPLIEQLTNLEKLNKERVLVIILPLRISGLDACPVRVIAIEED